MHGRDIGTQQRFVSDGSNLQCSVGLRSSFILPSLLASGTEQTFPHAFVLYPCRPPVVSEHVEPFLAPDTVDVGAGPLEQATQTGSPASVGGAQSESESSGREVPLLARDRASELPESTV